MPSVAEFVQNEAETTLKLGKNQNIDVVIRYRPNEITASRLEQMRERDDAGDILSFVKLFEETVIEWDLEGPLYGDIPVLDENGKQERDEENEVVYERKQIVGEGEIIPIDSEILKFLPQPFIGQVWRGLVAEQSGPDPQTQRGSRRR